MTDVTREVRIQAPKEKVWDIIKYFAGVQAYGNQVIKSYPTSEATGGLGATRHCDLTNGTVEERIVEWTEGNGYKLLVFQAKPNPPIKDPTVSIYLREDGENTIAYGTASYEMKGGPIGALLNAVMIKSQMNKMMDSLFAGLKYHVETGKVVEKDTPLDLTAVSIPA